mgnify:CR=1 FL=1
MNSGDSIRVVHPLFQEDDDGSIPISPLQLSFNWVNIKQAVLLNELWHSRLPIISNPHACRAIAADFCGIFYAIALWGPPIARLFNNKGYYELRRMAIAPDAPKNTASRMLKIMRKMLIKDRPELVKLISYQDTDVHSGTIYKASGWKIGGRNKSGKWDRPNRFRIAATAPGEKIRWEYDL